ncbi:MAG: hypothetical protein ACNI26_05680 [Terasakiella sp.]|uniref:hypothetical protein n=1 Tax=unclassified Terasakiella TaxID=2614952 RepID=UPI003B00FA0C
MQDAQLGRIKLKMDKTIREINQVVINPEIPELSSEDLEPVFRLVAKCRAAYLKQLFHVTLAAKKGLPDNGQIQELADLRNTYEEILKATQALETAIERGYLDMKNI